MPPKTIKQAMIRTFESLEKKYFKKFRTSLCDRREEPRISAASVEDADQMDIADVLVRMHTEKKAARVAIEVLRDIDCNEQADELETFMKNFNDSGAGVHAVHAVPAKYMVGDRHFVDVHRTELIKRVSSVAPIMDDLLEKKILNEEVYSDLKAERTTQKKMRELFDGPLNSCGLKGKDVFYEILEKHEEYLMKDLK